MADSIILKSTDLQTLADRLFSRDVSKLAIDSPEQSRDLRIASQALRALLGEVDRAASVIGDLSRALRELCVSVDG